MRLAIESDLPQIVEIYNASIKGRQATADTEPVSVESRRPWFQYRSPDRHPIYVIEQTDDKGLQQIVGWLSFESFHSRPAYAATAELSIYIAPNWQGKGLAKRFLKHALDISLKLKLTKLVALIFSHNTPSIKLFAGFGFHEWGKLPDVAEMDGQLYSLTIMGIDTQSIKRLDGSKLAHESKMQQC